MTNEEWLNNTVEGRFHRDMMIIEDMMEARLKHQEQGRYMWCFGCGAFLGNNNICKYCGSIK